ncbi:MAG: hypothetical protein M3304_05925 [Actinomycetota bacterium]|nr:hypothetical protein [Actinomycetota bacterium]
MTEPTRFVSVPCEAPSYADLVDEARRVLERLERIERLQAVGASRLVLLAEVRQLLEEGEAWIGAEAGGTEPAREALDACRRRLSSEEDVAPEAA